MQKQSMQHIKKIMVIGSGPIIIGQGAEFDYSGTQACKVLKEHGYEVILVNNNPATIMTDNTIADKVYMEPLTVPFIEKIIEKEKPQALIAGMGGQTALNLSLELWKAGLLEKHNIQVLGTSVENIHKSESRDEFKQLMEAINEPIVESRIAKTLEEAIYHADEIGYPVVVRPAFTLGGTGGGICDTQAELEDITVKGLAYSITSEVLVEKSIKGWKEVEYEMMRDASGNVITVCNMENIDPVGIHTGDSIVVAPSQTLNDKEYQMLRRASINIVNALDIRGGCNVQMALDPESSKYQIIEVNPRVSRSSSLASKATGYPIAKVAAKVAIGFDLDEITNDVTGKTTACFEPTLDYCVVKIPRWPFDKFKTGSQTLGTMMMATGEVMAIGTTIESALMKAVRSLELGQHTLELDATKNMLLDELMKRAVVADDNRLYYVAELMRREVGIPLINNITGIDFFFLSKIKKIVDLEKSIKNKALNTLTQDEMLELKRTGFSDQGISQLMLFADLNSVRELRQAWNIQPTYRMVDTCGGEFDAKSPYYYSTYEVNDEVVVSDKKKVLVLGSGPIRIGQGVEFDYCTVHGVMALREMGIETIVINNNPETVSTDFNTADKLYFEPITEEDVMNVIEKEKPLGVIVQFGGQTAIKLAGYLEQSGVKILGTSYESVHAAEERQAFYDLMDKAGIPVPPGFGVKTVAEGLERAAELKYPVLVRPSYVLGGMGMKIVNDDVELEKYLENAFLTNEENTVLVDKYLNGIEVEVDAVSDGQEVLIPGIMEHLERAGVHSGDSISFYPPVNLTAEEKEKITDYTLRIAQALGIKGILNIQFIKQDDEIYCLEVNPRSSRTVPFISKVTGIPLIELSIHMIMGGKLADEGYGTGLMADKDKFYVKHPVFSMAKLPGVDIILGPEMKSTGEILSMGETLNEALYKGFHSVSGNFAQKKHTYIATSEVNSKLVALDAKKLIDATGIKISTDVLSAKHLLNAGVGLTEDQLEIVGLNESLINIINGKYAFVATIFDGFDADCQDNFKIRRCSAENKAFYITHLDTMESVINLMACKLNEGDIQIFDMAKVMGKLA